MWKPTEQVIEIISECDISRQEKFEKSGKVTMLVIVNFEVAVVEKVAETTSNP